MLWVPSGADYRWQVSSTTARPAAAYGTTITASASVNTMGSWATVMSAASVTQEVCAILVNINSVGASGVATDALFDIGIDPAGGTSFTVLLPYLIGGGATTYTVGGGVWYYFPIRIPAGSTIGARMQSQTASRTGRVWVTLFGQPAKPETTRVGASVEAVGVVSASSRGTAITAGTTSEGSWTSLGSLTAGAWWFQLGHSYNGTAQVAAAWHWDVGIGSSGSKVLIADIRTETTTAELTSNHPPLIAGCVANAEAGEAIYARGQCSGTPAATTGVAVYALR